MADSNEHDASKTGEKRFGCLHVLSFMVIAVIITAGATFLIVKTYLFPSPFKPVALTPKEEKVLAVKLEDLHAGGNATASRGRDASDTLSDSRKPGVRTPLEPEPYSEEGLDRQVVFTERELNGLLAQNTDLADKLAIDLSDDLVSAKLLLPIDKDFPILGGKVLRLRSGLVFSYKNGKPVVILKGVTIMGVPVPNAWLGGLKNVDLVAKFGETKGFWKTFSEGVEDIRVEDGLLKIRLKE